MYKLIVRKFAEGWTWRFYRNNVCIAKSGKGCVNHYNARRAFNNFMQVHIHNARYSNYTIEIVKPKRKVP
jgi:hypothetical protein